MSKMGNWVIEMQEAAADMGIIEFSTKYGESQLHIWEEVNGIRVPSKGRTIQHIDSGYGDEIPF